MAIIDVSIISDSNKYDVCYHQKGTEFHSICDTEEKVISSVKKYLAMQKQYVTKVQGDLVTGNDMLKQKLQRR